MLKSLSLILCATAITSCASIVSKSKYDVRISSTPDEATVQVLDRKGMEIFKGTTPAHVVLKCSSGYFQGAYYTIRYTKPGYLPKEIAIGSTVNGWYFGNLLFGGLIGFLIVDPLTGAMFRLERTDLNEILTAENRTGKNQKRTLEIVDIKNIPDALRQHLVLIQ